MSKSFKGPQYATVEYSQIRDKYNCSLHGLTQEQLFSICSKPEWKASGYKHCRAHAMDIINLLSNEYGFYIKSHKTSGSDRNHHVYLLERNY